jgi:hypothetical protein
MLTSVRWLAFVAMSTSLVAVGYTLDDLQNGPVEALSHWWSTLAILCVGAAALAWFASGVVERRRTAT